MAFKLTIKNITEKKQWDVACPDEPAVARIGRKEANEVFLDDPRQIVGRNHAEIRQKEGFYLLVDPGSTNGTLLNGEPLLPKKEYPLKPEDRITIGDFVLQFFPVRPEETISGAAEEASDATVTFFVESEEGMDLLAGELSRAYVEYGDQPEERRAGLAEILRKAVQSLDPAEARNLLNQVEMCFPEEAYQRERLKQKTTETDIRRPPPVAAAAQASYEALKELAARYAASPSLNQPEEATAFVRRLDQAMAVMVSFLANALKGHQEFQKEFDVEATRIFMRRPNPIKAAEGEGKIGAYLFNPKISESTDTVMHDLQDAFDDLLLHATGMMAGFRECLRGLLNKLRPSSFESQVRNGNGFLPAALRYPWLAKWMAPLIQAAAWKRFCQKHQELSEDEIRTFEQIWGPFFSKGYLSVQKKKRSP